METFGLNWRPEIGQGFGAINAKLNKFDLNKQIKIEDVLKKTCHTIFIHLFLVKA